MLTGLEDAADHEPLEVPVAVGHAATDDAVDLAAREHELPRELLERQVDVDVLARASRQGLSSELPQDAQVVLPERAQVGQPVAEHRDALDAQAEGEARPLLRVEADVPKTSGSTQPAPPISIQPECLHVAQPAPPQMKHVMSNSTDGSVNGKKLVRIRTSRSWPKSSRTNWSTVPRRSASVM